MRELKVGNANQATQIDLMRKHFESQSDTPRDQGTALATVVSAMPQKNVMDVGKIGRPENLTGTFEESHKKWKDWIFVFGPWSQSANP